MEVWKDVEGFEGRYSVSNEGRVRGPRGRVLKLIPQSSGYHSVKIGFENPQLVHRLVAKAFCGDGSEVNHINCDKRDNRAVNLEWCTRSQNQRHAFERGRITPPRCDRPVVAHGGNGPAIIFSSAKQAAGYIGRAASGISTVCLGKQHTSGGYKWSYA